MTFQGTPEVNTSFSVINGLHQKLKEGIFTLVIMSRAGEDGRPKHSPVQSMKRLNGVRWKQSHTVSVPLLWARFRTQPSSDHH